MSAYSVESIDAVDVEADTMLMIVGSTEGSLILVGTIISQPGSMTFLLEPLALATVPFI